MADHILVVEDEARIRDIVRDYFTAHGLDCDLARDGEEALDLLRDHDYDAMLLDVLMPNLDGFSVCRAVRAKSRMPILFLTALGSEEDVLQGYALGADDYVVKPFSPKELIARVKAVLKRVNGGEPEKNEEPYQYKDLVVNPMSYEVTIAGKKLSLTPKEFELLVCFIKNKGSVMTREQLLDQIWGYDFYGDSRTVDTHVKMLRNNLGEYRELIKTVWGVGYRYDEE